jgi:hypothetical protein
MPLDEPHTISLRDYMADKGPLWKRMVRKHGLIDVDYEHVAAWGFGDFIFRCDWDVISARRKSDWPAFTMSSIARICSCAFSRNFASERPFPERHA